MEITVKHHQPTEWIYEKAREKFGVEFDAGAIFTYGNVIYCVTDVPDDLMTHELVHVKQQTEFEGGPDAWWQRYFDDAEFRLDQELKAYRRQYNWAKGNLRDRTDVWRILEHCAKSLSSPMYRNLVTRQEAKDLIQGKNVERSHS